MPVPAPRSGLRSFPATTRRTLLLGTPLAVLAGVSACSSDPNRTASDSDGSGTTTPSASPSPTPEPVELPGGGREVFPDRRMVALYGTPGVPGLGCLGEQDLQASITRVKQLAKEYEPFSEQPIIPAFEIIATVASAEAGPDGDYSNELDPKSLKPWIDAAGEAGVYCVLDLQPGSTDFLTQAKRYEDLLRQPHVGLALDPEWRLQPGARHMVQVGSVGAAEVNEVAQWLAGIVREDDLPQKVLILHQFSVTMLPDRASIDATVPELAMVIHADGHGTRDLKLSTWETLKTDLPQGMRMAWKNFYDEDTPTWTPEQTYDNEPKPWFVSYQ